MGITAINVRNQFRGKVKEIIRGPVVSEVDVDTPFGIVTSVITTRSIDELELEVGAEVVALVKSTEVSIARALNARGRVYLAIASLAGLLCSMRSLAGGGVGRFTGMLSGLSGRVVLAPAARGGFTIDAPRRPAALFGPGRPCSRSRSRSSKRAGRLR